MLILRGFLEGRLVFIGGSDAKRTSRPPESLWCSIKFRFFSFFFIKIWGSIFEAILSTFWEAQEAKIELSPTRNTHFSRVPRSAFWVLPDTLLGHFVDPQAPK